MTLAESKVQTGRLAYNRTIGVTAMFGRGLYYPVDLAAGNDDRLYMLNRSSDADKRGVRVTIMDLDEGYYGIFGSFGEDEGQFTWPNSIAIDKEQRVFVSDDYMNRISVMSIGGDFIARWGDAGAGDGQLDGPNGLAFNSDNELLVGDHRNNRIQRFTTEGEFLGKFGEAGSGEGQFNLPWGISVCDGRPQSLLPTGATTACKSCRPTESSWRRTARRVRAKASFTGRRARAWTMTVISTWRTGATTVCRCWTRMGGSYSP